MPAERGVDVLPGVRSYTPNTSSQRFHQSEYSTLDLMRTICRITLPGGTIFDPFMGSGTMLLVAAMEGYDSVGYELSEAIFSMAAERMNVGEFT